MKEKITKIWSKIDGYKFGVSLGLWIILRGIRLIWPHSIPEEWGKWLEDALFFTGGMGAGHKVQKYLSK